MANVPSAPDYRQSLNESIVETAEAVIARTCGVVEATHRFMELAVELDVLEDDDFRYFIGLDAKSDGFPVGPAREYWSASALAREDLSRAQFEQSVHDEALAHCRSLIAKYTLGH
jgi:hypothetical protein